MIVVKESNYQKKNGNKKFPNLIDNFKKKSNALNKENNQNKDVHIGDNSNKIILLNSTLLNF